jgi:hypothetical protein
MCTSLSSFAFESGSKLNRIGKGAFSGCASLESICIPASIEIVGEKCFYECTSLSSFAFEPGSKLNRIGKEAFSGCASLESICIPASVRSLPLGCLHDCPACSLQIFRLKFVGMIVERKSLSLVLIVILMFLGWLIWFRTLG